LLLLADDITSAASLRAATRGTGATHADRHAIQRACRILAQIERSAVLVRAAAGSLLHAGQLDAVIAGARHASVNRRLGGVRGRLGTGPRLITNQIST